MARVQVPRGYVRDRQFGSGVFKKLWFNEIPERHQKGHWNHVAFNGYQSFPPGSTSKALSALQAKHSLEKEI